MPPGGEGKISIKVNTKGYGGRKLMKTISVITNDSKAPESSLTVSGNVEKFVTITPSVLRLNGNIGDELKALLKIIPESKYQFSIIKLSAQEGTNIKYELKEDKAPSGGKEYSITVENLKKDAGSYYDVLIIETDSKIQPEIKINVMARITDPSIPAGQTTGSSENVLTPHSHDNDSAGKNGNSGEVGINGSNADRGKNFLEVIQKMQQQNATGASGNVAPGQASASGQNQAPIQDPKRAEELKKKFEALIKQAQEKQKAQEYQNSQGEPQKEPEKQTKE
ncbi:MAG: hypothetical protein HQK62_03510 [Desulfamplus sp.]|nr:hypothetical protein [Desulfamplus sp.]